MPAALRERLRFAGSLQENTCLPVAALRAMKIALFERARRGCGSALIGERPALTRFVLADRIRVKPTPWLILLTTLLCGQTFATDL